MGPTRPYSVRAIFFIFKDDHDVHTFKKRADKGGENVSVCDMQVAAKCLDSFLTGRSVHNQPIERHWRDVCQSCMKPFLDVLR